MNCKLELSSTQLSTPQLQKLTRNLAFDINKNTESLAEIAESDGGSNTKGDVISIGTIALAALSSGSVVALFEVIRSYFSRAENLKVCLSKEGRGEITFEMSNMSESRVEETLLLLRDFLGE